jgi:MFS family permease
MLMALGGALMVPTVMALFRIAVPPERLHRVFGYFGAMMGIAAAVGPSLGGVLVAHFGWPAIFVMNLPPLLLSAFFAASFFRGRAERSARLHRSGMGRDGDRVLSQPHLHGRMHGRRAAELGMYTLLFELPYLLQLRYQWGPGQAGPWMTAFMVSMMAGSAVGGRLAERRGARTACLAGASLSALGFLWLAFPSAGEWPVAASLILAGAGLGLANAPSQSSALGSIDRAMSGVASGVIWIARYVGGVLGITMLASVLAAPGAAQSPRAASSRRAGARRCAAARSLGLAAAARPRKIGVEFREGGCPWETSSASCSSGWRLLPLFRPRRARSSRAPSPSSAALRSTSCRSPASAGRRAAAHTPRPFGRPDARTPSPRAAPSPSPA